jgi:hypothetical protein
MEANKRQAVPEGEFPALIQGIIERRRSASLSWTASTATVWNYTVSGALGLESQVLWKAGVCAISSAQGGATV